MIKFCFDEKSSFCLVEPITVNEAVLVFSSGMKKDNHLTHFLDVMKQYFVFIFKEKCAIEQSVCVYEQIKQVSI